MELDGRVIGNIMYTKAKLADEDGNEKEILTFGPVMAVNEKDAERYDAALEKMEKKHLPGQEEFYIMSHSFIEE